jgi:hypothetical protein
MVEPVSREAKDWVANYCETEAAGNTFAADRGWPRASTRC